MWGLKKKNIRNGVLAQVFVVPLNFLAICSKFLGVSYSLFCWLSRPPRHRLKPCKLSISSSLCAGGAVELACLPQTRQQITLPASVTLTAVRRFPSWACADFLWAAPIVFPNSDNYPDIEITLYQDHPLVFPVVPGLVGAFTWIWWNKYSTLVSLTELPSWIILCDIQLCQILELQMFLPCLMLYSVFPMLTCQLPSVFSCFSMFLFL